MQSNFQSNFGKYTLAGFVSLVSLVVMISWFFGIKEILSIIPNSATMKFNTALLFLLSAIGVILHNDKNIFLKNIYRGTITTIIFISLITYLEQFIVIPFDLDNLFIQDIYSTKQAGRMSTGTAFSFLLISLSFTNLSLNTKFSKLISQILSLIILFISFIGMVTYFLLIPGVNKTIFFETMAIHTSILFLILAIYLLLQTNQVGFIKFILQDLSGSNLLRKLLPIIIILPLTLSYILLYLVNKELLKLDFAVVLYTIILIVIIIIYFALIAKQNNTIDAKNQTLSHILSLKNEELIQSNNAINEELLQFNNAINKVTIVAITDKNGIIEQVNDNFCQLSQYSKAELIGQNFQIIDAKYHEKSFFENLWITIKKGDIWSGEIRNKAKDGSYFWVKTAIIPLKDEAGTIKNFMAIQENITSAKEAEMTLTSKNLKLVKKNSELEQFTYIASHDLQEPLRTIASFSAVLTETLPESALNQTAKDSLLFINQSTERMKTLITGLLDYARIGKKENLETIDVNDIVNHVSKDLNMIIEDTKTKIFVKNLPTILGYQTSLRLLFQNLISNAIKFRASGKTPEIIIAANRENGNWEFSIQDNGIGIKESQREKIFIIFQRLHLDNQYEGTGIGLAHCRKIVEMHGGEIWVEVAPNGGSIFKFTVLDDLT